MVGDLAKAAVAIGADALEIEVHCNPEKALSDASQQLTPAMYSDLMAKLNKIAAVDGRTM